MKFESENQKSELSGRIMAVLGDVLPFPFLGALLYFFDLGVSFFLHILDNVKICTRQSQQKNPVVSQQRAGLLLILLMALRACHRIALMVLSLFGHSITVEHISCAGVPDMSFR